jgi:polyisoprenoid-binding protein YceI
MPSMRRHRFLPRSLMGWLWTAVAAVVVVALLAVGGSFVFTHFIEGKAPPPLSLGPTGSANPAPSATSTSPGSSALAGTWTVSKGARAGYRVQEILFGQQHTAVGRTGSVNGHIKIQGTTVTAGTFTAQMGTVKSDQARRDAQFRGRIMDTSTYPTSTFTLTHTISLAPVQASGTAKAYTIQGNLTLRGKTRPVTFQLTAERGAGTIKLAGSIPIVFANWDIPNPSFAGLVTTQNHGTLEFLLILSRS